MYTLKYVEFLVHRVSQICIETQIGSTSSSYGLLHTLGNIDGLVQERRNSIANTLELGLSCINPPICRLPLFKYIESTQEVCWVFFFRVLLFYYTHWASQYVIDTFLLISMLTLTVIASAGKCWWQCCVSCHQFPCRRAFVVWYIGIQHNLYYPIMAIKLLERHLEGCSRLFACFNAYLSSVFVYLLLQKQVKLCWSLVVDACFDAYFFITSVILYISKSYDKMQMSRFLPLYLCHQWVFVLQLLVELNHI